MIYFQIFIHISVNIIFKNNYILIAKYIYDYTEVMITYFVIRNFRCTCLSAEMFRLGVHGQWMIGNAYFSAMILLSGLIHKCLCIYRAFLRRFRDPLRVPSISNRVFRIRENYHRVPKIRENPVTRIREIGSLQIHTGYLTFSLKKPGI